MVLQWSCNDKLFKKLKIKIPSSQRIYKIAQYELQKLVSYKKHFLRINLLILLINLKSFEIPWFSQ